MTKTVVDKNTDIVHCMYKNNIEISGANYQCEWEREVGRLKGVVKCHKLQVHVCFIVVE
jgi:hypothetical protein